MLFPCYIEIKRVLKARGNGWSQISRLELSRAAMLQKTLGPIHSVAIIKIHSGPPHSHCQPINNNRTIVAINCHDSTIDTRKTVALFPDNFIPSQ